MSTEPKIPPPISKTTPHFAIASGLYSGCFPVSPGTIGSAACLAVWCAAAALGLCLTPACDIALIIAAAALGVLVTERCLAELTRKGAPNPDPQFIVIDEWAGLLIPLALAAPQEPHTVLAAFVLFRLFDILKPWPVSAAERLPGAWGVMADDLVAGALAAAVLYGGSLAYLGS